MRGHLSYLKLDTAADALPRVLDQARAENLSMTAALERLLGIDVNATEERRLTGRTVLEGILRNGGGAVEVRSRSWFQRTTPGGASGTRTSMANHSLPARRRSAWRPVALAVVGGAVLAAMGAGVWATLSATASNATPETVSSGTLKLTLAANGAGFDQAITNLAPGDVVNRYVDLTSGGSLDAQALTMQVAATGSSALVTDGATTKALRVTVKQCVGGTWTAATAVCSGTAATVLPATALSGLGSAQQLVSTLAAGSVQHLQVSVQLPDQTETTVNGALPAATIQGLTANLTYTFAETQRSAVTTNS